MSDAPSKDGGTGGSDGLGWRAQLGPELQNDEYFKGFKNFDEASRRHKELVTENETLKKQAEGMVKIPGENASQEEVTAYHRKLGWPEKPEDYGIEAAFPAGMEGGAEFLQGFLKKCHDMKVPKNIAQGMFEWYTGGLKETVEAQLRADQDSHKEAIDTRKKAWGDKHDVNMEIVRRALKKFGIEDKDVPAMEKLLLKNPALLDVAFFTGDKLEEAKIIEGTYGEANAEDRKAYLKKVYKNSPEIWS